MSEEINNKEKIDTAKPAEKETKPTEDKQAAKPPEKKGADDKPETKTTGKSENAKKVEKTRPTNCAACNKAFKHKRWYYKNGRYFCTKRCWKKIIEEKKKQEAEKAAKEAQEKQAPS